MTHFNIRLYLNSYRKGKVIKKKKIKQFSIFYHRFFPKHGIIRTIHKKIINILNFSFVLISINLIEINLDYESNHMAD